MVVVGAIIKVELMDEIVDMTDMREVRRMTVGGREAEQEGQEGLAPIERIPTEAETEETDRAVGIASSRLARLKVAVNLTSY